MSILIPILVIVVLVIAIAASAALFAGKIKLIFEKRSMKKTKSTADAQREANRRLAKNPRDTVALNYLGGIYFDSKAWDKALQTYATLADIPDAGSSVNILNINLRAGIAAMALGKLDEARKYFVVAYAQNNNNPDVNFRLGLLEFNIGDNEKAINYMEKVIKIKSDDPIVLRTLGHALFKIKRPKEAMEYIRKAIEHAPNDKESLWTLAECYAESGQKDQALRIYSHLRTDTYWGPRACLASGLIRAETYQEDAAISDFETGLNHEKINGDVATALNYQLAKAYLQKQDVPMAFDYLNAVKAINSDYKDTNDLIEEYREISMNYNLQVFTMGDKANFIALCRKIVFGFFPKARVKINKTTVNGNDWADIVTEVDTQKWSNIVMFRFIRTPGTIGELVVRDFHSHLKDAKADKGICAGMGTYSDEARRFTEARLIDLIDRERLVALLNNVDSKTQATKQPATQLTTQPAAAAASQPAKSAVPK